MNNFTSLRLSSTVKGWAAIFTIGGVLYGLAQASTKIRLAIRGSLKMGRQKNTMRKGMEDGSRRASAAVAARSDAATRKALQRRVRRPHSHNAPPAVSALHLSHLSTFISMSTVLPVLITSQKSTDRGITLSVNPSQEHFQRELKQARADAESAADKLQADLEVCPQSADPRVPKAATTPRSLPCPQQSSLVFRVVTWD